MPKMRSSKGQRLDGARKASGPHQDRTFRFLVGFTPSVGTKTRLYDILKVQNTLID